MTRERQPSRGPSSRPQPIALEARAEGTWLSRCAQTVGELLRNPSRAFAVCPEPISHGTVLRFLATLRLPPWILLVVVLGYHHATKPEGMGIAALSIHEFIEPSLTRVISAWVVLMIPVGLPLLYFFSGLTAHIGVALTGGASRSIGASMRACGYVLAPLLLIVGLADVPLYLGMIPGIVYCGLLGLLALVHWGLLGVALARTHQTGVARGWMASLFPTLVFIAVTAGRAVLELAAVPGLTAPGSPYALP